MSDTQLPNDIKELLAGYVLDDLSPKEVKEVEELLSDNPTLVLEVKRLQEAFDLMPYALNEVEPPPQLRKTILEQMSPTIAPKPIPWAKIIAGTTALVALYLGLDNVRLRQALKLAQNQRKVINVLQQANTRVFSLVGTENANQALGNIAIDPQARKAVIVFQNLPTAPKGQIYRLWAIIDNKKIACADFRASAEGKVLEEFSLPVDVCGSSQSTLAVTLEPLPSPPQPVGPAMMIEKRCAQ
jgi:anti-sigma-K factor RskA